MIEHAERTDINQPLRPVLHAGRDNVSRAPCGTRFKIARAAAHRGADVVDDARAVDGVLDDARIAKIADDDLYIGGLVEFRAGSSHEYAHSLAAGAQRRHQCATEKSRCAGHQHIHRLQWSDACIQLTRAFRVGLCIGYALMGAGWLTHKSKPEVRDLGFRVMPKLMIALFVFLALVFGLALADDLSVMRKWLQEPALFIFPAVGALACVIMIWAIRGRRELVPFLCAVAVFAAAMGTLSVFFYPCMIPFAIDNARGGGALDPELHVLGHWRLRAASYSRLHPLHLLRLQGQGCRC